MLFDAEVEPQGHSQSLKRGVTPTLVQPESSGSVTPNIPYGRCQGNHMRRIYATYAAWNVTPMHIRRIAPTILWGRGRRWEPWACIVAPGNDKNTRPTTIWSLVSSKLICPEIAREACQAVVTWSLNILQRLTQLYILLGVYFTPHRLHLIGLQTESTC